MSLEIDFKVLKSQVRCQVSATPPPPSLLAYSHSP